MELPARRPSASASGAPTPLEALEALGRRLRAGGLVLPLLPAVPARVLSLASDESGCEASELADLLQRDPALAGNVLRLANSSAWAPEEPIVSLQQAVARLGFRTVCDLAVSVALKGEVFRARGHEERLLALWRHSAETAIWAREIARQLRRSVEGAFLCGLMHEVGKPVILQTLIELGLEGDAALDEDLLAPCMDELHESAGALLAREWNLPEWMAGAVGSHHRPEECGEHVEVARVVRLADRLSHAIDGAGDDATDEEIAERLRAELAGEALLERLGLYPEDLAALIARRDEVSRLAGGFV